MRANVYQTLVLYIFCHMSTKMSQNKAQYHLNQRSIFKDRGVNNIKHCNRLAEVANDDAILAAQGFSVAFIPVGPIFEGFYNHIAQVSVEFSAFLNMITLNACTNNLYLTLSPPDIFFVSNFALSLEYDRA